MSALDEIRSNVCPYCGAPYTLVAGGCSAQCARMQQHDRVIRAYLDSGHELDEREEGSTYGLA